jgi:hypothetical protein
MGSLDLPFTPSIDGQGAQIDLEKGIYFNKKAWNGLYLQNTGTIGAVWFKENIAGNSVGGRYAYWSLLQSRFGLQTPTRPFPDRPIGRFHLEMEIKGSALHGVDNKYFDNFNPRVGLKIGYTSTKNQASVIRGFFCEVGGFDNFPKKANATISAVYLHPQRRGAKRHNVKNTKMTHKAGFVNIIGNPNVGKSTLMNAFVGERLSIITSKAQTTRHRILGIVNGDDFQMVFPTRRESSSPLTKCRNR